MSSSMIALIAIILASLFWATAGVVAKILLQTFDPFTLAYLRFLVAGLVILPLVLIFSNLKALFSKKVLLVSFLSSLNIAFFYFGLQKTTANASVIIYTATPLIVAVLGHIFLRERLTKLKITGILIGFGGVILILVLPIIEKGQQISGSFTGNLLVLAAANTWAFYTLFSRKIQTKNQVSPLILSADSIIMNLIVFLSLSLMSGKSPTWSLALLYPQFWLLIHLGTLATVATLLLYQWAIKHASAVTASLSNYIQPFFAIWLAVVFLEEKLTLGLIIGSILVIFGVVLATGMQLLLQIKSLRTYFKRHSLN